MTKGYLYYIRKHISIVLFYKIAQVLGNQLRYIQSSVASLAFLA